MLVVCERRARSHKERVRLGPPCLGGRPRRRRRHRKGPADPPRKSLLRRRQWSAAGCRVRSCRLRHASAPKARARWAVQGSHPRCPRGVSTATDGIRPSCGQNLDQRGGCAAVISALCGRAAEGKRGGARGRWPTCTLMMCAGPSPQRKLTTVLIQGWLSRRFDLRCRKQHFQSTLSAAR